MENQKYRFDLFAIPFSVDVNTVPRVMQMETIELQSFKMSKVKCDPVRIADLCKKYIQKSYYLHLHGNAKV